MPFIPDSKRSDRTLERLRSFSRQTPIFFVFSQFKKMLEISRVSLKSDFNVKFVGQHAERAQRSREIKDVHVVSVFRSLTKNKHYFVK